MINTYNEDNDTSRTPNSDKSNIFQILISSDNHLGYLERDPVIGDDSFRTFNEMLETANNLNVDLVLLGGDLFHDNRPSASTYFKTSQILNKHVFG